MVTLKSMVTDLLPRRHPRPFIKRTNRSKSVAFTLGTFFTHLSVRFKSVAKSLFSCSEQQPPLYHVPTYTDQHEKDLHSIETQLQNMMWYQQQTLVNISKSQAEYMAELREIKGKQQELYENNDRFYHQVREEQREMAKEIQQVKNYQVNQTMVDSTRNKAVLDELAARQLRDWTRNASARECYTVWAHQKANSNLVEMSSQKVVKQIYDNIDHKRPKFQGLLKSDLPPSDSAPPPSSSNNPKNPPK
ncbi:hypothetical protein PIB30_093749 [Stylosanthes scabra]|uniref:Uncharacterized protein n=1 Tax=Stylosanthes scabra TaxID=79078 RepID=A0ABU6RWL7_9FABA|nr:hypothetical protein [Stylosanthes scabra]